jgi:hypothetical protein
MGPQNSLPCSQDPATGHYPDSVESSSHPLGLSIAASSSHLRLGLPSGVFISGFLTNILTNFSFHLCELDVARLILIPPWH